MGGGKRVRSSWIGPVSSEKRKAKLSVQREGAGRMGKSGVCGVRGTSSLEILLIRLVGSVRIIEYF